MPVFMCRWSNGDFSFVSARNKSKAKVCCFAARSPQLSEPAWASPPVKRSSCIAQFPT